MTAYLKSTWTRLKRFYNKFNGIHQLDSEFSFFNNMEHNSLQVKMIQVILASLQNLNSNEKENELFDFLFAVTKKEIFGGKDMSSAIKALEDKYEVEGYESLNLRKCAKDKPKGCLKQLLLAFKMYGVIYDAFDIQVITGTVHCTMH